MSNEEEDAGEAGERRECKLGENLDPETFLWVGP